LRLRCVGYGWLRSHLHGCYVTYTVTLVYTFGCYVRFVTLRCGLRLRLPRTLRLRLFARFTHVTLLLLRTHAFDYHVTHLLLRLRTFTHVVTLRSHTFVPDFTGCSPPRLQFTALPGYVYRCCLRSLPLHISFTAVCAVARFTLPVVGARWLRCTTAFVTLVYPVVAVTGYVYGCRLIYTLRLRLRSPHTHTHVVTAPFTVTTFGFYVHGYTVWLRTTRLRFTLRTVTLYRFLVWLVVTCGARYTHCTFTLRYHVYVLFVTHTFAVYGLRYAVYGLRSRTHFTHAVGCCGYTLRTRATTVTCVTHWFTFADYAVPFYTFTRFRLPFVTVTVYTTVTLRFALHHVYVRLHVYHHVCRCILRLRLVTFARVTLRLHVYVYVYGLLVYVRLRLVYGWITRFTVGCLRLPYPGYYVYAFTHCVGYVYVHTRVHTPRYVLYAFGSRLVTQFTLRLPLRLPHTRFALRYAFYVTAVCDVYAGYRCGYRHTRWFTLPRYVVTHDLRFGCSCGYVAYTFTARSRCYRVGSPRLVTRLFPRLRLRFTVALRYVYTHCRYTRSAFTTVTLLRCVRLQLIPRCTLVRCTLPVTVARYRFGFGYVYVAGYVWLVGLLRTFRTFTGCCYVVPVGTLHVYTFYTFPFTLLRVYVSFCYRLRLRFFCLRYRCDFTHGLLRCCYTHVWVYHTLHVRYGCLHVYVTVCLRLRLIYGYCTHAPRLRGYTLRTFALIYGYVLRYDFTVCCITFAVVTTRCATHHVRYTVTSPHSLVVYVRFGYVTLRSVCGLRCTLRFTGFTVYVCYVGCCTLRLRLRFTLITLRLLVLTFYVVTRTLRVGCVTVYTRLVTLRRLVTLMPRTRLRFARLRYCSARLHTRYTTRCGYGYVVVTVVTFHVYGWVPFYRICTPRLVTHGCYVWLRYTFTG